MLKRIISTFIIFILNFQLAFAGLITNYSKAQSLDKRVESFIKRTEDIKIEIRGSGQCEEEVSQNSYEKNKENKITSYAALAREIDEKSCLAPIVTTLGGSDSEKNKCQKADNILSKVNQKISELEADDDISEVNISKLESTINSVITKGKSLKRELSILLKSGLEKDIKKEIILQYNQNIALSLRDLLFLLGTITSKYEGEIEQLLPSIPQDLFEQDTIDFSMLLLGLNPTIDPMQLDIVNNGDELQLYFNNQAMIGRDIKTLMENPSAKNYLYALRVLTTQMLVTQIQKQNILIGNPSETIKMPLACLENKQNGIVDEEVRFGKVDENFSSVFRNALLRSHGLYFDGDDTPLLSKYYIDYPEVNLATDSTISRGTVEFDSYKNAIAAVEKNYLNKGTALRPVHDDYDVFDKFIEMKIAQAEQHYYSQSNGTRSNGNKKTNFQYKDILLLNEILTPASMNAIGKIKDDNGEDVIVNFSQVNASVYLMNKMKQDNVRFPEDYIKGEVLSELESNKIKISFPSLYSPAGYRNWGLNTLTKAVEKVLGSKDKEIFTFCRAYGNRFCSGGTSPYMNIYKYLKSLQIDGHYLPLKKLNEKEVEKYYYFFNLLWNFLRDKKNVIPQALTTEEAYLRKMMLVGSPWARTRLSYLVARDEIKQKLNANPKKYKLTRRGKRPVSDCTRLTYEHQLNRLNKAISDLGLNHPLQPAYASKILTKDESKTLFEKVLNEVNEKGAHTFSAKINENETAYDIISRISFYTLNTVESVNKVIQENIDTDGEISDSLYNKVDKVFESEESKKLNFYFELAREKDHEKREEMFFDHADEYGLDDDLTLKEDILYIDSNLKQPLYEEVIVRAAKVQKKKTQKKLAELCAVELNDHEKIKEYFFSTLKVQDELNQKLGLQSVPKSLMDKIYATTSEENWNMVKGLGGFVLGAASLVLLAACPFSLGTTCAVAGGLSAASGALLGSSVMYSEYHMKRRADGYESNVKESESIGLSEAGASDNVSRSWAWTIISSLDVIPLVGIVSKGIWTGTKMTREAITSLYYNHNKLGFSESLRRSSQNTKVINQEADVHLGKLVLGFTTYSSRFKSLLKGKSLDDAQESLDSLKLTEKFSKEIQDEIDSVRALHKEGKISAKTVKLRAKLILDKIKSEALGKNGGIYNYVSDVSVNYSKAEIDLRTAKTLVSYFNENPAEFEAFINKVAKKYEGHSASKARLKYLKAKNGGYESGGWIRKMWYENTYSMAKNHLKFKRVVNATKNVKTAAELEKALVKVMDDFSDVFVKNPLSLIDIPYEIIRGGPHLANTIMGRIPGLKKMGMGVIVRKIANSRALLLGESVKAEARAALNLSTVMAADSVARIMKGFQAISVDLARNSIPSEGAKIIKELDKVKALIVLNMGDAILQNPKLVKMYASRGVALLDNDGLPNTNVIEDLLFNNQNAENEVLADMLWNIVDLERMMTKRAEKSSGQFVWNGIFKADKKLMKDEFQFLVSRGMHELINDTSVEGIQKYLLLVKLLKIKDGLGSIDRI